MSDHSVTQASEGREVKPLASKPKPGYRHLYILNIPEEWYRIIEESARNEGMTISNYVKAYILKPWVLQRLQRGG